jgi:hypothetical protein
VESKALSRAFYVPSVHGWELASWNRVLLEKLIVFQGVNKFTTFFELRKPITIFINARHWCLSWCAWIQPTLQFLHFMTRFSVISNICLGFRNSFFPSGFPTKVCAFLSPPNTVTCSVNLLCFYLIICKNEEALLCANFLGLTLYFIKSKYSFKAVRF